MTRNPKGNKPTSVNLYSESKIRKAADSDEVKKARENVKRILSDEFTSKLLSDYPRIKIWKTNNGKSVPVTPIDGRLFEQKKLELGITNQDIVNFMNKAIGKCISLGTLQSKLTGKTDFTVSEILMLTYLFDLDIGERIDIFKLYE